MRLTKVWSLAVLAAVVVTMAPSLAVAAPAASPPLQANLFSNPDMEGFAGNGVANGWEPWWEETTKPGGDSLDYVYKPNWVSESNPVFVKGGSTSQHIGRNWDPWHAGIRQTISAAPGSVVRVTAWARVFASTPDYPNPSDGNVQARMRIGAEPNGSIEWFSNSVKWSGTANPHDTWAQLSLDVTAGASGKITVFLSSSFRGDSRYHLDVWWDAVSATVTSTGNTGSANTAVPGATQAPASTAADVPAASTAFRTPTPGSDGMIVYVVQPNDTLWRIAAVSGVSVDQIKALNGLSSDFIAVGQRLIIGQGSASTGPTSETSDATDIGLDGGTTAPVDGATQASTQLAQVSPTPAGTGTVCALLYIDANGNGVRDTNEALLAGGQLTVVDISTGAPVEVYTTDGLTEPHCFEDLPAGQYTISSVAPTGYNTTTVDHTTLALEAGSTFALEFGAQPSASSPPPAQATGGRALRTALFGAAGVVFLLLAAGVAAFLFLRRPG